jgi:hypothetical protein
MFLYHDFCHILLFTIVCDNAFCFFWVKLDMFVGILIDWDFFRFYIALFVGLPSGAEFEPIFD